jgi:predicted O-methyltransferase YrrM
MKDKAGYKFTQDWFSHNIPTWQQLFSDHIGHAPRILEIGSFEGRASVWMIERLARSHNGGELICVDQWINYPEAPNVDMAAVNARFEQNIYLAATRAASVKVHAIKSESIRALGEMVGSDQIETFDFIYIDGSHRSSGVLVDAVLSFALCKVKGILAFDDYLWKATANPLDTPRMGIDFFANAFADKVEAIRYKPLYQVYFQKMAS